MDEPMRGRLQGLARAVGFAGRYGAVALGLVMIVAMSAAVGPTRLNVPVFIACVTIAVLGTGPYSQWDPPLPILGEPLSEQQTTT